MENERHKLWYSIISYVPNFVAYERINIGVIMGDPLTGKITYKIIFDKNKKFRYFLRNDIEKKIYKTTIDYLDFILKRAEHEPTLFQLSQYKGTANWSYFLNGKIPENIIFSNIHFARTANDINVFNNLLSTYVGDMFLPKAENNFVTLKKHVFEVFESKKLIGTKLKSNLKIRPAADLPLKFEMDYAYLTNNNQVSFIQIGPKQSQINEWYKNNVTLLSKNTDNFSLNMVIKEEDYEKPNQTFKPFLSDLESDSRVKPTIVTGKDSLSELVKSAGKAIPISEWNTENKSYIA
jgi:hypothetical protein